VQALGARQMRAQRLVQTGRQHRHPVLRSLAVANRDLAVAEVDVLHPQLEALAQPQPRAVQQGGHQPLRPLELRQQRAHLLARKHHRRPYRALGPHDVLHPGQLHAEHRPVEKEKRRERLILGRGCHVAPAREVRKKRRHFRRPHLAWVPLAGKIDRSLDPVHVRLLGAVAVMPSAYFVSHLVQQPWRRDSLRRILLEHGPLPQ
jgi:hypothetical protein